MKPFLILFALALCIPLVHGAESALPVCNVEATDALLKAAKADDLESAATAIDNGADVDAKDVYGWAPLPYAARNGHEDIVKLPIDKGATIGIKTPISDSTPLHWAIYFRHEAIASLLIDNGASIDAQDKDGQTPLHWTAIRGQEDVAQLLIDKGADMNAQDESGRTPLHYAATNSREDVVQLLIDKGADINAKDKTGLTPLHWAADQFDPCATHRFHSSES